MCIFTALLLLCVPVSVDTTGALSLIPPQQQDEKIYDVEEDGIQVPKLIKRVDPEYPEYARAHSIVGFVRLQIVIDKQGHIEDIEVLLAPQGRYGFIAAATKAVKRWEFEPKKIDGEPVKVRARFSLDFKLNTERVRRLPSLPPGIEGEEDYEPPRVSLAGLPPFPRKAALRQRAGQVKVRLLIHADGSWEFLDFLNIDPEDFGFDEAMLQYLKQSTWQPATYKGEPIDTIFELTVNFTIR